jgi:hypothetical protein
VKTAGCNRQSRIVLVALVAAIGCDTPADPPPATTERAGMKQLPETEDALVLRTDFSDDGVWEAVCQEIHRPVEPFGFMANVDCVSDLAFSGLDKEQLLARVPAGYRHTYFFVTDATTVSHGEHPLLVIDLSSRPSRDFRAAPWTVQGIEDNLSIANMDFGEFADRVDVDGVFRGF